ncbi:unnamed protein product [Caenorhabditis brenneri]
MKLLFFANVLLIFCVFQAATLSKEKQEDILKTVNDFRNKYATKEKITDMNALIYNPGLEQEAHQYSTCDNYKLLKNTSLYFPSGPETIDEFFEVSAAQKESQKSKKKFGFDHVLNPTFRSIGCALFEKTCPETVMYTTEDFYKMITVETRGICFLSEKVYCPDGIEEHGLCKVIPKSESSVSDRTLNIFLLILVILSLI